MKRHTAACRICGKEFIPCKTCYKETGIFNWREMCCSADCGKKYLLAVEQARNPKQKILDDSENIAKEISGERRKKTI